MWISSDEIYVSAEEDVFEFILTWIDHDKVERKKYFSDLFRHVRLVHVSHDYLHNEIETNKLVKDNEDCLLLLKAAAKSIELKHCDSCFKTPRKSLESPVMLLFGKKQKEGEKHNLCYFPLGDKWYKVPDEVQVPSLVYRAFSCHDKLYLVAVDSSAFTLLR